MAYIGGMTFRGDTLQERQERMSLKLRADEFLEVVRSVCEDRQQCRASYLSSYRYTVGASPVPM